MEFLKTIIGGLIGGAVGGAIWLIISYSTGYEVGWIAWGVGFLVGIGVRFMAQTEGSPAQGIVAAGIAIVAILGAKYADYELGMQQALGSVTTFSTSNPDAMISMLAHEIVEEREAAGKKVTLPALANFDDAPAEARFPPDIWREAKQTWASYSPEEQAERIAKMNEFFNDVIAVNVRNEFSFDKRFSPYDFLWFGLAAFTAFRIGASSGTEE